MYGLDLPDEVLKKLYYKNALEIIPGIDRSLFPASEGRGRADDRLEQPLGGVLGVEVSDILRPMTKRRLCSLLLGLSLAIQFVPVHTHNPPVDE